MSPPRLLWFGSPRGSRFVTILSFRCCLPLGAPGGRAETPQTLSIRSLHSREIQTRSAPAVTFYTPAATAERYKGAWAAQKTPYLTIRGQLPREKTSKIEYQPAHMTNVLGAEG